MDIQRFGRWQLNGLLRGCAIQLVATIVVFSTITICIAFFYLIPVPRSWEDLRFVLGLSSGVILTIMISWMVLLLFTLWRRQKLNQLFSPYHAKFSIRFLGQRFQSKFIVAGRTVTVVLQRGPMLSITADVATQTRLSLRNGELMELNNWEQLKQTAADPKWLKQWSDQPEVHQTVLRILSLGSPHEVRTLWFTPEKVWLQLYRFPMRTLTSPMVTEMVKQFATLLEAARSVSATDQPQEQNALERFADSTIDQPNKAAWLVVVGIMIIIAVLLIPVLGLVLLANLVSL